MRTSENLLRFLMNSAGLRIADSMSDHNISNLVRLPRPFRTCPDKFTFSQPLVNPTFVTFFRAESNHITLLIKPRFNRKPRRRHKLNWRMNKNPVRQPGNSTRTFHTMKHSHQTVAIGSPFNLRPFQRDLAVDRPRMDPIVAGLLRREDNRFAKSGFPRTNLEPGRWRGRENTQCAGCTFTLLPAPNGQGNCCLSFGLSNEGRIDLLRERLVVQRPFLPLRIPTGKILQIHFVPNLNPLRVDPKFSRQRNIRSDRYVIRFHFLRESSRPIDMQGYRVRSFLLISMNGFLLSRLIPVTKITTNFAHPHPAHHVLQPHSR